jgi:transcriptional regulator with XRE-family HTH domain
MSLLSKKTLVSRIRRGKEARAKLVSSNLDKGIAFQLRATREARELTQEKLADIAGMSQNNICRLESPDYGKHTISSLKRLASALDVALVVRLVPFTHYTDWLSGTPYLDEGLRPSALAVPSFQDEEKDGLFESKGDTRYWKVTQKTPFRTIPENGQKFVVTEVSTSSPVYPPQTALAAS